MDSPNLSVSYAQLGNLASVKERELHEINETRVRTLEAALASKSASLDECRRQLSSLKEDFVFNLRVIEERDGEITSLEAEIGRLREREASLDAAISDLKADQERFRVNERELRATSERELRRCEVELRESREREIKLRHRDGERENEYRDKEARLTLRIKEVTAGAMKDAAGRAQMEEEVVIARAARDDALRERDQAVEWRVKAEAEHAEREAELMRHLRAAEDGFARQRAEFEEAVRREVNSKAEDWRVRSESLKAQVEAARAALGKSEDAREVARLEHARKVEELEVEVRRRTAEADAATREAREGARMAGEELKRLAEEVWRRDAEISSLRGRIEAAQADLDARRREQHAHEADLAAAGQREAEQRKQLIQQNMHWEAKLQATERALKAEAAEALASQKRQAEDLRAAVKRAETRGTQFQAECRAAEERAAKLAAQVEGLEDHRVELETRIEIIERENARLLDELRTSEDNRRAEREHRDHPASAPRSIQVQLPQPQTQQQNQQPPASSNRLRIDVAKAAAAAASVSFDNNFSPLKMPSPLTSPTGLTPRPTANVLLDAADGANGVGLAQPRRGVSGVTPRDSSEAEVRALRTRVADLESQNERFRAVVADMRAEMEEMVAGSAAPQTPQHNELLRQHNNELSETVKKLQSELARMRVESHRVAGEGRASEEVVEVMRAEQRVASEEVIGLQSRVRALQQELANKQRRVEELELATHSRSMRPHHAEVGISTRTASMAAAAGSGDEIARLQAENSMLASQRSELALEVERLRAKLREAAIDLKRLLGDRERLIDLSNELRADLALAEERSRDGLAVPHLEQRVRELEALVRALRRELSRYAAEEDLLATERLASASLIDEAAAATAVAAHGRGLRRVRSSQYDEDNRRHRGHLRRASMDGSTTLAPPFTPNSSAFAPSTPAALDRSLQRLQEAREHLAVAGAAPPSAGLRPRSLSQSERTTISQTKARIKSSQRGEFVEKRRQARNYNIKEDWE